MSAVYLDFNASTPADERVVAAMLPHFTTVAANASSVDHDPGHQASRAVRAAREHVAALVGARPAEVVFTSGATEADNLAILGTLQTAPPDTQLVISAVEHPAVREAAARWGDRLRVVAVHRDGQLDLDDLDAALGAPTALVSVMTANNETGVVQPLAPIVERCDAAGVPVHTDAVQAAGRMPLAPAVAGAALVSLSAHKMYGPQGAGALVVRRSTPRARLAPVLLGGGQERGLRPGTLNVPGIVGFGTAAKLVVEEGPADWDRERALGARLIDLLRRAWPEMHVVGDPADGLPQTLHVRLPGVDSHAVVRLVASKVALSTGSACTTTNVEPSAVLLAMGLTAEEANECLRLSWGRQTTTADINTAGRSLVSALDRLRPLVGRT